MNMTATIYRLALSLWLGGSAIFTLRREFARLHGISAARNLAVLAGGVVLVILP